FRDKGVPIDNLCNYKSANEQIIYLGVGQQIGEKQLLFGTKSGMVKQVSGSEFLVTKKEVMATKLNEDDQVLFVKEIEEPYTQLILKSKKGMFHRFLIEEIPTKKKGAIGVRGMQLSKDDFLETYWL